MFVKINLEKSNSDVRHDIIEIVNKILIETKNQRYDNNKFNIYKNILLVGNVALNLNDSYLDRYPKPFLKIAEIYKHMGLKNHKFKTFLDIGSDPGSFSLFLLSEGYNGVGISISNEKVEERINHDLFNRYTKKYNRINKDFFETDPDEVGEKVDVIVCDIGRGGNNSGFWDSYDPSDDSDTLFHIKVLTRAFEFFLELDSEILVVKMFNTNEYGLQESKVIDVDHGDRTLEVIRELIGEEDLNIFISKPFTSDALNNEYYLIISKFDVTAIENSWLEALEGLQLYKYKKLVMVHNFYNNIGITVIKRAFLRLEDIAALLINNIDLPRGFQSAMVRNEKSTKKRSKRKNVRLIRRRIKTPRS